ncbi:hypothetical protein O3P69_006008 [Scylla paramamosain]|uniref:Osteoclast-stimulating factor 1 n=1 Tax=Scylla paramamosain TaxID=85552 RepID=A0AAW0U4D1_SCYPA
MSVTLRTAPPPPPIRKGHVQVFEATSNYKAQRDCELSFEEGDLLFVLDRNDPKWWLASSNRKKGYIPSDLVTAECIGLVTTHNRTVVNKIGDTPLHCAAVRGHCEVLKVLLKHGANPDLTNREDQTPRTLAKRGTIITLLDQGLEYEETGHQGDDIEDSEDSD